jgi:AcrR family transcriptional regulator
MPARLSRKEKQAQTRSSLMRSAARIFCRHGLERTSIEEVAEDAGYTKGAFYANFRSKQELFLAMLDERFTERIEEVDRAFAEEGSPPEQARQAAADFARAFRADPGAERLFLEFASYALRDEDFREELLTRFATLRERLERVYQRRTDEYGLELDIPMERIVRMVIAMADGWALWQLLDPEGVDEDLLETMIELFTIGVGVRGGALELGDGPAPASPRPASPPPARSPARTRS